MTNSFDADAEHQRIQTPAKTIPNVPLELKKKNAMNEKMLTLSNVITCDWILTVMLWVC